MASNATHCHQGHKLTERNIIRADYSRADSKRIYCGDCRREYGLAFMAWVNDPERRAAEHQHAEELRTARIAEREKRRAARRAASEMVKAARKVARERAAR